MTSPDLALELADVRLLVRHADMEPRTALAAEVFHGCPKGDVVAALPKLFATNGKAETIRRAFVDVADWQLIALPGHAGLDVWRGAGTPRPSHFR